LEVSRARAAMRLPKKKKQFAMGHGGGIVLRKHVHLWEEGGAAKGDRLSPACRRDLSHEIKQQQTLVRKKDEIRATEKWAKRVGCSNIFQAGPRGTSKSGVTSEKHLRRRKKG